jgi:hypothetical protein
MERNSLKLQHHLWSTDSFSLNHDLTTPPSVEVVVSSVGFSLKHQCIKTTQN